MVFFTPSKYVCDCILLVLHDFFRESYINLKANKKATVLTLYSIFG